MTNQRWHYGLVNDEKISWGAEQLWSRYGGIRKEPFRNFSTSCNGITANLFLEWCYTLPCMIHRGLLTAVMNLAYTTIPVTSLVAEALIPDSWCISFQARFLPSPWMERWINIWCFLLFPLFIMVSSSSFQLSSKTNWLCSTSLLPFHVPEQAMPSLCFP